MSDRTFTLAIVIPAFALFVIDVVRSIRRRHEHREAMRKLREELRTRRSPGGGR